MDAIFEHPDWPLRPFIEIAEELKLTKKSKRQHQDAYALKEIDKKVTRAADKKKETNIRPSMNGTNPETKNATATNETEAH